MQRSRQTVCLLIGFIFLMTLGNGTLVSAQEKSHRRFSDSSLNQDGKRVLLLSDAPRSPRFSLQLWSTEQTSKDHSSAGIRRRRGSALGKFAAGVVWGVGGFMSGFLVGVDACEDEYPEGSDGIGCALGWEVVGGAIGTAICLPTGIYLANRSFEHFPKGRNTTVPVIISPILPSTGHAYAGCWKRGLLFAAGRLGCLIFMEGAGYRRVHRRVHLDTHMTYREQTAWFYVGVAALLGTTIWETVDAQNQVVRHNQRRYEQMSDFRRSQAGFLLSPVLGRDHVGLRCVYTF